MAASGLAILLLVGLLLRLTIAYVFLPGSGFESDIGTFTAWAFDLGRNGPGEFYANASFADYPPGYLYVLWLIGGLGHALAPMAGGDPVAATAALIKVPAMVADVLVGLVLYVLVRSWRGARPDAHRLGLIAAALYVFNPVTSYDSAIWGQTDAFGALIALVTLGALARGNSEGASALAVLAALIKPQFGILLLPIVGIVLLRRHLLRPGSGPRQPVLVPQLMRDWFENDHGPWRLVSSAVVGLVVLLAMLAPFSLDIPGFLRLMTETAGGYPYLSVNAYNPWALVGADGNPPLAFSGPWSSDTVPLLGPLPGVVIGGALLVVGFAVGVARVGWRDDRRSLVIVTIFLALCFFMLPTRVHERYMFPIFGLLPLLAAVDRRWLWATVALSVAAFINLHGVLTTPLYASPNVETLPLGEFFRQPLGILISIALHVGGFAFVAWQMRRSAAAEPDPFSATSTAVPDQGPAPGPDEGDVVNRGWLSGSLSGPRGVARWLLSVPAARRDRSAMLVGEPGGRLDRRDLLLVVLLFVSALVVRGYRLEEPYSMHFDEVYHARTAIEFLQDWRYDMPHSIYEYTHPHMAKYLMAIGIDTLGNNRVTSVRELGGAARAVALERRWAPPERPGQRNGDFLYVIGDNELRAYDLATGSAIATLPGSYDAVAVDGGLHELYVADAAGMVWHFPTAAFAALRDDASAGSAIVPGDFSRLEGLAGELDRLVVAGNRLIAVSSGGTLVSMDLLTGEQTGRATVTGATGITGVNARTRVVVDPAQVSDSTALAGRLADLLGDDAGRILGEINRASAPIAVAGALDQDRLDEVQGEINAGELEGVTLEDGSGLVVGGPTGLTLLDAQTLGHLRSWQTGDPVAGLSLVEGGVDTPTVYAASGEEITTLRLPNDAAPQLGERLRMPNLVSDVIWNQSSTLVHVVGRSPDGSSPTVYVIDPHSNAVFADAALPFEPSAVVIDVQPDRPAEDRSDLVVLDEAGTVATVDVGSNAFAWRFPGVLLGALMAACIYLLARFLFQRRSVAILAGLLVLADGMFFSNARIAMNDAYVSFFIVAAFTVFTPLWLGRWRSRPALAVGLVAVGILLGLALASKWVGAYAIGGVGLLILVRSALGRFIALAALIGMTGVLGLIAVSSAEGVANPQMNVIFLGLMVALTTLLAIGMTLRPVRMTPEELRLAVIAPLLPGLGLLAFGAFRLFSEPEAAAGGLSGGRIVMLGGALVAVGLGALLAAWLARRFGIGPLARAEAQDPEGEPSEPPPPRGWLRPGSGPLGLSWVAALGAITLIPLGVYALSYVPWIDLGNRWTTDFPAGGAGQTFLDLQRSMYDYHNYLRATHAASSPWWAWPLDLKPVWFEQQDYAGNTTGVIYNTGNLVIFWLSIPAVAWVALQAWRRRSLPLTLLVLAIASLWLPWARIDRATFQYHIFTTLPFSFLALAYFLGELWNGPSARTWLVARVAAAVAIVGAPLLWLLRPVLCGIARTEQVNAGTEVCARLSRTLELSDLQVVGLALAVGGLIAAGVLLYTSIDRATPRAGAGALLMPALFSIVLLGVAIVVIGAGLGGQAVFSMEVIAEAPALVALLLLAVPAYFVLRASDPRRYVVGALAAAAVWFVTFYPNIASLPVPRALSQIHLGLLPTWNWAFQFGVNLDEPNRGGPDLAGAALLSLAVAMLCVAAAYAAHGWRADRAERSEISALPEAG